MILADTSVWIDLLRTDHPRLRSLLEEGRVHVHPFIVGELMLGFVPRDDVFLDLLSNLPSVPIAEHVDVVTFVERRKLRGVGIGWVDAHLLVAAELSGCALLTSDRKLRAAAVKADVAVA